MNVFQRIRKNRAFVEHVKATCAKVLNDPQTSEEKKKAAADLLKSLKGKG